MVRKVLTYNKKDRTKMKTKSIGNNIKKKILIKVDNIDGNLGVGLRRKSKSDPEMKNLGKYWLEPVENDDDKSGNRVRLKPLNQTHKSSKSMDYLSPDMIYDHNSTKITLPRFQQPRILEPIGSPKKTKPTKPSNLNLDTPIFVGAKINSFGITPTVTLSKENEANHFYLGENCLVCKTSKCIHQNSKKVSIFP